MCLKKYSLLICATLASYAVSAQADEQHGHTDKIIDTFLACDNQFFEQLADNKTLFNEYIDLTTEENVTFIPVKSVVEPDKYTATFKKALSYRGLTITGYQNIYIPTALSGQFYYWGFIFDNSEDEIKKALSEIKWNGYNTDVYIANSKIYNSNTKVWQDNPYSIDGVIPKQGTVEKSLYLEPFTDNQNRIMCSIQGDVKKSILYASRPDMRPIDIKLEGERREKSEALRIQKERQKAPETQTNSTPKNNIPKDGDNI
ncbi:hypothetical protein [Gilliamella sp. ESL0405]|uniref:hypothetical protein n=1 Tax=Gilliamella sp. ESL0405 TaxID=2704653 RepID=UPI001C69EE94|nr:hypothetical protein [Gilliamella sp. ESL0405]QYN47130.1 hypothetical protein GYM74_07925 [Gilliamella sp. ESL0405]